MTLPEKENYAEENGKKKPEFEPVYAAAFVISFGPPVGKAAREQKEAENTCSLDVEAMNLLGPVPVAGHNGKINIGHNERDKEHGLCTNYQFDH